MAPIPGLVDYIFRPVALSLPGIHLGKSLAKASLPYLARLLRMYP